MSTDRRENPGRERRRVSCGESILVCTLCLLAFPATPAQTIDWVLEGTVSRSHFGQCVSDAGDVDGDGTADILVGAPFTNHCGAGRGSVHVISGADRNTLISVHGDNPCARFGSSVSALGDINRDGYDDIAVGAPGAGEHGADGGAVVVVSGEWITARARGWVPSSPRCLLRRSGVSAGDRMGASVAAIPDVNMDGVADLLVGAPGTDCGERSDLCPDAGAAHVVSGADGSILRSWYGFAPYVQLGRSVAQAGDADGDGRVEGLLGGPIGFGDFFPGVVLVVSLDSGTVLHTLWGHHVHSGFGWSVAGIGDVDGDMCADLAIGSPFWSSDGSVAIGRVDVFSGSDGSLLRIYRGDQRDSEFGAAVTGVGDVDGDDVPDLAVGAPHAGRLRLPVPSEGAVDVFSGVDGRRLFRSWGLFEGDEFGRALGGSSDRNSDGSPEILAGAPLSDVDALVDAGRVLVLAYEVSPPDVAESVKFAEEFGRRSVDAWKGSSTPLLRATPNPFRDIARVMVGAGVADGTVRVVSVDGRVVRTLVTARQGVSGVVSWDGRDSQGTLVTPGVYFVTARGGSRTEALRLVRVR